MSLNNFGNIYLIKNDILKMLLNFFSNIFLIKKQHYKNVTKNF